MNQVCRLGNESAAQELFDPHVMVGMQIVGRHFHAHPGVPQAQRLGQTSEHLDGICRLGSAEGSLGIDDPFGLAQRRQKGREGVASG